MALLDHGRFRCPLRPEYLPLIRAPRLVHRLLPARAQRVAAGQFVFTVLVFTMLVAVGAAALATLLRAATLIAGLLSGAP